jgi:hypothetical protein
MVLTHSGAIERWTHYVILSHELKIIHTQNNMMLCNVKPYSGGIPQIKGLGCCNRRLRLHILRVFLACGPLPHHRATQGGKPYCKPKHP